MEVVVTDFQKRLSGKLSGILHWTDLDALWAKILADPEGWYLYEVGESVPTSVVDSSSLAVELQDIDRILREKHKHDYCSIVYADEPGSPSLVKIYDPANLGMVCGPGGEQVLPKWIISRDRPEALEVNASDHRAGKALWGGNWWRRILK